MLKIFKMILQIFPFFFILDFLNVFFFYIMFDLLFLF